MNRTGVRAPALGISHCQDKADDSLTADRKKSVRPPGKANPLPGDSSKKHKQNREKEGQAKGAVRTTAPEASLNLVPIDTQNVTNNATKIDENIAKNEKEEEMTLEVFETLTTCEAVTQGDVTNGKPLTKKEERTESLNSQDREERWNRTRIIYPNAGHNEVLVTLGESQRRCEVTGGTEATLVSKRAWHSYVRLRRNNGRPHLAYEAHMKLTPVQRANLKKDERMWGTHLSSLRTLRGRLLDRWI